ncbi:uncharacterized protein CANTADRAFT_5852 [Suhomyces tanzawaensis NRRL Y-17324]|uniref:Uncharacterized protein n=1 Tax=Suhomyces tanzawaensis NRRL Y-17324 TaxID=984487 RepID=A0A1E4SL70_9ASCO|nr:uncharacterized protein CANTADRAFT_5852 [Suhomyces tanzawaensis NRRL Y-17324]ODV80187.1 hypothetical protein CANTADRAFT_5852 [Suhomyces tanzawaensis NRRL Y-17324]
MPSNFQYTAAKSSRITKRPILGSPIKKLLKGLKYFLDQPKRFQKVNLAASNDGENSSRSPKSTQNSEPLTVQDYNVQLDYQLSSKDDILVGIDTILSNQWAESSSLNQRYHDNQTKTALGYNMEELVFSLKGLGLSSKAEIMKYRANQLPKGLITTTQLYSMYDHQGNTFVDRNIEIEIRKGSLRKFVITNASPVILNNTQKFQNGKVTYGFENVEVLCKSKSYLEIIDSHTRSIEDELTEDMTQAIKAKKMVQIQGLQKFRKYIVDNPTALFIDNDNTLDKEEMSILVTHGLVTLTSNHLNEIESHQYSISYPACGTYLKLINAGRVWLVKLLSKNKYKESLEETIVTKWEGTNFNGTCKMNNFRKPFYGFELNWILADALGVGLIEVFNTPVGRGWRLTGKV